MDIFETIGYIIGVLLSIFITVCIPIFVANYSGLTGIKWYGLVVVVALMAYTIISMITKPVSNEAENIKVFVDAEGNLRDSEGNIIWDDNNDNDV